MLSDWLGKFKWKTVPMLLACVAFLLVLRVIIDFSLQHYVEAFPPAPKPVEKEKKDKDKEKKKPPKEKEKIGAAGEDAMTPKKKTD